MTRTADQPPVPLREGVYIRRAQPEDIPALAFLFRAHLKYHAALDPRYAPPSEARLTDFFRQRLQEPDTLMVFTHSFPEGLPPAQHATGWHACFEALDAVLDERPVPPLGYDEELRRHYDQLLAP